MLGIAVVFCAAGSVKGITGMGLPTVAVSLLALWMSPATAAGPDVYAEREAHGFAAQQQTLAPPRRSRHLRTSTSKSALMDSLEV